MTQAIDTIRRVLASGLLEPSLLYVPKSGATELELQQLNELLSRHLSAQHAALLRVWNGINLDVIRLYGATSDQGELRTLSESQNAGFPDATTIAVGDDPSGFIFGERADGCIVTLDTKNDSIKVTASDLNTFLCHTVFGLGAEQFAGSDWANELRAAGVLS